MNDNYLIGIEESSKLIQSYTYPLLRVDSSKHPEIFASCQFIEVEGSYFLITAAHAVRGNQVGLMTRGVRSLIDVVGCAAITRSSDKDHIDIAVININEEYILENDIKVIPESMFISSVEVINPHSRVTSGFPISMNKNRKALDKVNKVITSKCFTYFGYAEFDGDYTKFNKSPSAHIGIEYKAGKDNTGKIMSSPPWPPKGVSGGGAWVVPNLSKPEMIFFEGIFIEGYKSAKRLYGFSTQLVHILDFIQQTHNKVLKSFATLTGTPQQTRRPLA